MQSNLRYVWEKKDGNIIPKLSQQLWESEVESKLEGVDRFVGSDNYRRIPNYRNSMCYLNTTLMWVFNNPHIRFRCERRSRCKDDECIGCAQCTFIKLVLAYHNSSISDDVFYEDIYLPRNHKWDIPGN